MPKRDDQPQQFTPIKIKEHEPLLVLKRKSWVMAAGKHATDSQWRSWRMNFLLSNSFLSLFLSKYKNVFPTKPPS